MSDPSLPQYPDFPAAPPPYPPAAPPAGQGAYPAAPPPVEKPDTIKKAVQFMYAGAVCSALTFVISAAGTGSIRQAIRKAEPTWTAHHVNQLVNAIVVAAVVSGIIGVGLWLWMAWANGRGRSWARIVGSVFFAIETLGVLGDLGNHLPTLNLVVALLPWLCGIGAMVMMWNRASTAYYKSPK